MKDRAPLYRRRLGRELRRLREQSRMTQEEASETLRCSDSKISRFESGQRPEYSVFVALLDRYGLTVSEWQPYIDMWERAAQRGWWTAYRLDDQGYVSMEDEAVSVREHQTSFVPGLLQTEGYARKLFSISQTPRSDDWVETQVAVRMHRQSRLTAEEPLRYEAIIQEGVLRRPIDDSAVHRAQLRQIVARASLPNVTVRVLAESAGNHEGLRGTFTLLCFPDNEDPDVAYVEHALGAEHIEVAAQVSAARLRLDHLSRLAMGPAESIEFIEQVVTEL